MRTVVLLAGGQSTRFGKQDKALAELAGTPMIRRVADRVSTVADELVINCRADQRDAIEAAMSGYETPNLYAEDHIPDQGPVAGIRHGLDAASGEYSAVLACDMPFVDPDFISQLFDRAAGHDGAVPRLANGWLQTTQAVYRTEPMLQAARRVLEQDNPGILTLLSRLDYIVVEQEAIESVTTTETFENINTREEFERAQERFNTT